MNEELEIINTAANALIAIKDVFIKDRNKKDEIVELASSIILEKLHKIRNK